MELKLLSLSDRVILRVLLIVPYGIETFVQKLIPAKILLLIVPYGIETLK